MQGAKNEDRGFCVPDGVTPNRHRFDGFGERTHLVEAILGIALGYRPSTGN
jgi:hypothetical protein